MSPTPRAAMLVGLLAVGAFALPVPLAVWAAVLAGAVGATVADLLLIGPAPAVTRTVGSSLVRGKPAPLTVTLATPARAGRRAPAASYRVRQPVPPELRLEASEAPDELSSEVVALVRGRYVLPPVAVRATGPLGLARHDFALGGPAEVSVYPDLPGARLRAARRRSAARPEEGRARAALGLGTDLESVREYTPDDDVRRINWYATSRVGRPMTNQYRIEQDREVLFVVDTGRLMAAPVGEATRLDLALDALAAVAASAEARGDRVGALVFADKVRREVAPRRGGTEGLVLGLADLETVDVDSDYARAFHRAADRKRAIVVVLTDLLDDSASRHLADAVPVLARRHPLVVASVQDPDLRAILTTPPARTVDVLEMTVALDLLASRDRVIGRLRRHGASVVDRPQERFAGACVAAYLNVKNRALA